MQKYSVLITTGQQNAMVTFRRKNYIYQLLSNREGKKEKKINENETKRGK